MVWQHLNSDGIKGVKNAAVGGGGVVVEAEAKDEGR